MFQIQLSTHCQICYVRDNELILDGNLLELQLILKIT